MSAASNVLVTIDGAWPAVIRPAETSVAAACMTVRAGAVSQESGRSARKEPSGYIKDDILQFNQSCDSMASL